MKQNEKTEKLPEEVIIDRSIKLNPNNELFWKSRGFSEKPEKWQEILKSETKTKK